MKDIHKNPLLYYIAAPVLLILWPLLVSLFYIPAAKEQYRKNEKYFNDAVPVIKKESHLPVFVDPSHAAGRRDLIEPLAKAAVAVGADGLMVEVHDNPEEALSDGDQSVIPGQFDKIMKALKPVAASVGRTI